MTKGREAERSNRRVALTRALQLVRERRGLTKDQVAELMGLETRTYSRFEAAEGQIDLERLWLFAEVTDCDPYGLVAALDLEAPHVAALAADAKFAMLQTAVLETALVAWGTDVRQLDAASFVAALEAAMEALGEELRARSSVTRDLLGRPKSKVRRGR